MNMKPLLSLACLLSAFCARAALAAPEVKIEHGGESPKWPFRAIVGPSRSAASRDAKITVTANKPATACLAPDALRNGVMPWQCKQARDFFYLSDDNADDGQLTMDLGRVIPVAMVASYSGHNQSLFSNTGGARGPQVYALSGSADGREWTTVADVDTRPNRTGDKWGGEWGVNVRDDKGGLLGNFRYLRFDIKRTRSPRQPRPEWTGTWYAEIDVHTPETLKTAGDAVLAGSDLGEIVVAYKTHFDIGFTHRAPDLVNIYRTGMIDRALATIEASRQLPAEQRFAWTIPSWPMWQILWPGQTPERRAKVLQALKEGSLVTHALPASLHTESLGLEDLVDGLALHSAIARAAGIPFSRAGKMTDVPSHSWVLPTLLSHAGVGFLHIGCNSVFRKPDVPLLYDWEGPDGSRLLTFHNQGYGSDVQQGSGLYPPKDWPYKHWLAMIMTGDNEGPPSEGHVRSILAQAKRDFPNAKVRFGPMDDFAAGIRAEQKAGAKVPVVRADEPDFWIHGVGSMPVEDAAARRVRAEINAVESLDSLLRMEGLPRLDIREKLAAAHEHGMMLGEHTFGGNTNLQGRKAYENADFDKASRGYAGLERTWDDKRDFIRGAAAITDRLAAKGMAQLAEGIGQDGPRVVVFNPLPVRRDAVVETGGASFLARDLPPCGYRTFAPPKAAEKKSEQVETAALENAFLKVTVDRARGGIVSIIEKKTGRELVDPKAPHAFGQYVHERFSQAECDAHANATLYIDNPYGGISEKNGWDARADLPKDAPHATLEPKYATLTLARDAVAQVAELRAPAGGGIPSGVVTRVFLPEHAPWLEISVLIENKKADYWPVNDTMCFPVKADKAQFRVGRVGAVVDPTRDFVRGSNRAYGYVDSGAMIAGSDGRGVAICPLDQGIMSVGEKGVGFYDPDYVPSAPEARVSMFNNFWTINFPYWMRGPLSSRVRVWATEDLSPASLVIPAQDARQPVLVGRADGEAGKLPASAEGLSLSRAGVRLVTFGQNPDGPGTVLRVWEQAGNGGEIAVSFPQGAPFTQAQPVDLRGEKAGEAVPIAGGKFSFPLPAYAPASFVLTPELPVAKPGPPVGERKTTRLTELDMTDVRQGWGRPQKDKSVAGAPLKVGGVPHQAGIGVHSPMEWAIDVDGKAVAFDAQVGVQDGGSSMEFLVLCDGKPAWKSGIVRGGQKAVPVHVDLEGVETLTLQVANGGDGAHGDWIDPRVTHLGRLK